MGMRMYSRIPSTPPVGSRPASGNRPRGVYVPPNYGGTALGQEPGPTPSFGDLPQVSNLPRPADDPPSTPLSNEESTEESPSLPAAVPQSANHLWEGSHFPFGHGLGYEELFLLGLLLFLRKESETCEGDDLTLTLLLVGALLFCG